MSPDGDEAVVLPATNEEYPIQVVCCRTAQGWAEEFSGFLAFWEARAADVGPPADHHW